MKLYVCGAGTHAGSFGHPCGKAANALDEAGHKYETVVVRGFKSVPFTTGGGKRDEVIRLSGQKNVPILVLDDGEVVTGSKTIVGWAADHPAS